MLVLFNSSPSALLTTPARHCNSTNSSVKFLVGIVEPSGVQALKNQNPLKDVEVLAVLAVAVLV